MTVEKVRVGAHQPIERSILRERRTESEKVGDARPMARPINVAFFSMGMDASFSEFHPARLAPDSLTARDWTTARPAAIAN